MLSDLKRLYRRFRAWQISPATVTHSGEQHHCNNCGLDFTGRFCPDCGQRATAGRITWQGVQQSVMDVWGLGGRSLPYSLWQLMWRPGYFISDYINGKWQRSFPPVKMLVLVAVIIYLLGKAIYPEYWRSLIGTDVASISSTGWRYYYDATSQWIENHLEWMFLSVFSLLILPTWLMFRHSPRNSRHTLPQGFFVQVFMTIEYLVWLFIITTCIKLSGINVVNAAGGSDNDLYSMTFTLLFIPIIVIVNYKQLFGYGWWGTVWRILLMVLAIVICFVGVVLLQYFSFDSSEEEKADGIPVFAGVFALICVLFSCLMLSVADMINRRLWRERGWLRAMALPSLFLLIIIIVWIGSAIML